MEKTTETQSPIVDVKEYQEFLVSTTNGKYKIKSPIPRYLTLGLDGAMGSDNRDGPFKELEVELIDGP